MSSETILYAALSSNATLGALVAQRIYPDEVKLEVPKPAIAYARNSTEPVTTIDSNVPKANRVTIEVQCQSDVDRAQADAVADACVAPLAAAGFLIVDRGWGRDSELGLWATSLLVEHLQV